MLICSIIVLAAIAFFNILMGAATTVTLSVKGTGNAFKEVEKTAQHGVVTEKTKINAR